MLFDSTDMGKSMTPLKETWSLDFCVSIQVLDLRKRMVAMEAGPEEGFQAQIGGGE